ncbi:MAG: M23 family metallopeptidase [Spirochaetes bacterium]|nr:M23 family metallopeptidase [Spirochaetota bacterium]
MISPVNNPRITSPYGNRNDPLNPGQNQFHDGIDLASIDKDINVRAITSGIVVYDMDNYRDALRWVDPHHSAGNYVIIKHLISENTYYVRYLHLKNNTIKVGDAVSEGDVIGQYADVGRSRGAHLHMDMYTEYWVKINPTPVVKEVLPA